MWRTGGHPIGSRVACAAAVATVAMLGLPGAAWGWTAASSAGQLAVLGAAGEANQLAVSDAGGGLAVTDEAGNPFTGRLPDGCTQPSADALLCSAGTVVSIVVQGGDSDDTISNSSVLSRVALDGGAGDDELIGGTTSELLTGGDGADTILGGDGNDAIDGGTGNDLLTGGDGSDQMTGGLGDDRLEGSAGTDRLNGGAGQDALSGGDDADQLLGAAGRDQLSGGDGADTLGGGDDADTLDGDRGDDLLSGDAGDDDLSGGEGTDVLEGGAGSDRLSAATGNDSLDGGDGDDRLLGGDGANQLQGGTGNDTLQGADGVDRLDGGDGDDQLDGGADADRLAGGAGTDQVTYARDAAPVAVTIGSNADDGVAGENDDVQGDIEQVLGGTGPDRLQGSDHAERLDGGPGDDLLDGGRGDDELIGGDGRDTVTYSDRTSPVAAAIGSARSGEAGEGDRIDPSVEDLVGGNGDDLLTGSAASANQLDGGPGNDRIYLRDGQLADVALCGSGADTAHLDQGDTASPDCETVTADGLLVRPLAPPAPPAQRLLVGAKLLRLQSSGAVLLTVQCSSPGGAVCAGGVRLTRKPAASGVADGQASFHIAAGASQSVRIRLRPATLRRLRRSRTGSVAFTAHLQLATAALPIRRDVALRVRFSR